MTHFNIILPPQNFYPMRLPRLVVDLIALTESS